jgi:colanic acid/amylovoran biosynthesis glycosyltransferase
VLALPCVVAGDGNRDGLPVSIVEALACGVPVVATPVTAIPEVVRDGINGLLVAERDPDALADALEALLTDRVRLAALRAEARPSVVEEFDARATAQRLGELLRGPAGAVTAPSPAPTVAALPGRVSGAAG